MKSVVRIGLVGDYDAAVLAHQAIPRALRQSAEHCRLALEFEWLPTDALTSRHALAPFAGLWCVPASPYRNMDGALLAIQDARERGVPFLGTCGGFQHAIVEFARNCLGWTDAKHGESSPDAARAVIAPLECALVEARAMVRLLPGTRIAAAYGAPAAEEGYSCRYGLNPRFRAEILAGPLRLSAVDGAGEPRAIELDGHPFFVATLFQPERAALRGAPAPLVDAFVRACAIGVQDAAP
jgi:CTP synthase (UTP-ammonia lyase)